MGITKTENYSEIDLLLSSDLKALAHPARIAILNYLAKVGTCICNDIVLELPLAQPTISQHLKELKNAGFIKGNIEGNSICYCINEVKWKSVQNSLNTFFENYNNKIKCC